MQTAWTHIKIIVLTVAVFLVTNSSQAQRWQLGIYSGYAGKSFDVFGEQKINIAGSRYTGFEFQYKLDETFGVKMNYSRQDTKITMPCNDNVSNTSIERYELGFSATKPIVQNKLDWNVGFSFGMCRLFKGHEFDEEAKLSNSFNAGLNYHISKYVGLQLQGRLLQFYSKAIAGCTQNNQPEPAGYGTVVNQGAVTGGLLIFFGK